MYRQYIANSKKCYVVKVSLVELIFFLLTLDLLKCQINQGHFYNSIFRVTNSDSSMFCATVVTSN